MTYSVVIPAFEARATLPRAVRSVLDQAAADTEVIVVDDGSTDGGPEALERDPRLRVLRQSNAGHPAARNHALGVARHEWVAMLDADDFWLPGHLAELDRIRERVPEAVLIGTRCVETDRAGRFRTPPAGEGRVERIDYLERAARRVRPFTASSFAVRRDVALAGGGFELHPLGADTEFFVRLSLGHPVAASTRTTAVIVRGAGSMTERAGHRWHGAPLRDASEITPGVATALAADPPPPGLDAFVDSYVGWVLRASVQIADVATIRGLRALYRGRPSAADRVLLAVGRLPPGAARAARRPAARLARALERQRL